jgi:hypothetical protein
MKITCEKVSQEFAVEVMPLISAFGEVGYDYRTGKLSFMVGAKIEAKVGIVEGGFKSGIYMTSNGRGEISDVGIRAGRSVSISHGAAEYQVMDDMVDMSFISAFTAAP